MADIEDGYDPRNETRAASVPLVNQIDAGKRCAEELEIIRSRIRGGHLAANVAPSPSWWGVGPEPPLFTRAEAMAGREGVDYFPKDRCTVCARVPWWNGRSIVVEHDAGAHHVSDEDLRREPSSRGGSRTPSGPEWSRMAAHQRSRQSTGERDED